MNGRPFDIIDATAHDFIARGRILRVRSLVHMSCEHIVASRLMDKRRVMSQAEREAVATEWAALMREDAPLRIVRDGRLVSAPLTHYDAALTAQAASDWEDPRKVIGRTLHHLADKVDPPVQGVSDVLLFGRIQSLGDAGDLEIRGTGPGIDDFEVRRPTVSVRHPSNARDARRTLNF